MSSDSFDAIWWYSLIIFAGFGSIIACIITIMHSRNIYLDLSNNNKTREAQPKLLTFTILISLYLFSIAMVTLFISQIALSLLPVSCKAIVLIVSCSYLFGKMFMYLAFIVRLYILYDSPIFHYNLFILKIIFILAIVFGTALCILLSLTSEPTTEYGHKHIAFCRADIKPFVAALTGIYDIMFSICTMVAFIVPLRRIIKSTLQSNISEQQKHELTPLIEAGIKYSILTIVASLSTFLFMVTAGLGLDKAPAMPTDFIINMICMVLMTPYYNKSKIFEKLCCGIIKCSQCCLGYCCGYHEDAVKLSITNCNSNSNVTSPNI